MRHTGIEATEAACWCSGAIFPEAILSSSFRFKSSEKPASLTIRSERRGLAVSESSVISSRRRDIAPGSGSEGVVSLALVLISSAVLRRSTSWL